MSRPFPDSDLMQATFDHDIEPCADRVIAPPPEHPASRGRLRLTTFGAVLLINLATIASVAILLAWGLS